MNWENMQVSNRSVHIRSYSVRMWGITDQNNSKYGHFLHSGIQERDHLQKQLFKGILEKSSSENFGKSQGKQPWWCAVVDLHCECECFPENFPKLKNF